MRARSRCSLILALAIAAAAHPGAAEEPRADPHDHSAWSARPDAHAPIGVMGDHLHEAGEFMLSYRFMRMRMDGSLDGTRRVSNQDVFAEGFLVNPTWMDMEMHMFGAMWAPTDWLTLVAMVPYEKKEMEHRTRVGTSFRTKSEGVGDVHFGGLLRLLATETQRVHLNAGFAAPTGSIAERDWTPMGKVRLPYPMQIGTGSWSLVPGITYGGNTGSWSWGGQAGGSIRLDDNSRGYRVGNRAGLTAWLARPLAPWLSLSFRLDWQWWGNIHGSDPQIDMARNVVPTADPNRRGGNRLDGLFGLNAILPLGPLGRHRLAIEGGLPFTQHLDGPQLETDWRITVGWQYAFGPFEWAAF